MLKKISELIRLLHCKRAGSWSRRGLAPDWGCGVGSAGDYGAGAGYFAADDEAAGFLNTCSA